MPKRPPRPGARPSRATLLDDHRRELLAIDFPVVPTVGFDLPYVLFVMSIERLTSLHFNLTKHPTAKWTAQQIVEACAFAAPARFLIRDNDRIYGAEFITKGR